MIGFCKALPNGDSLHFKKNINNSISLSDT